MRAPAGPALAFAIDRGLRRRPRISARWAAALVSGRPACCSPSWRRGAASPFAAGLVRRTRLHPVPVAVHARCRGGAAARRAHAHDRAGQRPFATRRARFLETFAMTASMAFLLLIFHRSRLRRRGRASSSRRRWRSANAWRAAAIPGHGADAGGRRCAVSAARSRPADASRVPWRWWPRSSPRSGRGRAQLKPLGKLEPGDLLRRVVAVMVFSGVPIAFSFGLAPSAIWR